MAARPRVFVSSTIYDFRDLRSSLKYWLEELGCSVQMSEHSDFEKPLDENSYDACLRAIDSCDYFVLLIGARVGGWYSQADKISITRQEYIYAYERHKQGRIRIVPFVRNDLWNVKDDRRALGSFLREEVRKGRELTEADVDRIAHHPSTFTNDAEAIFAFIEHVRRSDDMRLAAKTGGARPSANWIHVFETFAHITDVLRPALGLLSNMKRRSMEANLRSELLRNLTFFFEHVEENNAFAPTQRVWQRIRLGILNSISSDKFGNSNVDASALAVACVYAMPGPVDMLDVTILEDAIRSGEFLEYDAQAQTVRVGEAQSCLLSLLRSVRWLFRTAERNTQVTELMVRCGVPPKEGSVAIPNRELMTTVAYLDAKLDVFENLVATYQYLSTGRLARTELKPTLREVFGGYNYPDPEQHDVEKWLASAKPTTTA